MFARPVTASSILALAFVCHAATQQKAPAHSASQKSAVPATAQKKPEPHDSSGEPFVIERYDTAARFENDGTGQRNLLVRIRIQSDEGARRFRKIAFAYNSAHEKVEVRSLTITKAGGSAVNALTPGATKEVAAAITHDFPAYTEYKEVHLEVPSLRPGDALAYEVITRTGTPFARGDFWFQHTFLRDAIVLEEHAEVNLPANRPFKIKSPGFNQIAGTETQTQPVRARAVDDGDVSFTKSSENGRVILRWKRANLAHPADDDQEAPKTIAPDIQLTSFKNWEAVAGWYARSARNSAAPSPQIKTKAEVLTKGAPSDLEKIRALYMFVAKDIRSLNFSPDLGGLQPLPSASVLANGYGDSLDKNALLEALLEATGIHSDAILIGAAHKLAPEVPSPAQFDRVLTVVSQKGKLIWMDPTAELAPFRFLSAALRGRSALLVSADGTGKLIETPVDPPFLSTQKVELDCRVGELGKLTGTVQYSLRGDTEFVLRTALRRAAQAQWNQIAQTILTLDGLSGEVASVTTSDLLDTEKPLEITIRFAEPNLLDWPSKTARVALPLPTIGTPNPPQKSGQPMKLGSPLDITTRLRLTFPPGVTVQTPVGVAVSRDYAEFRSSYSFENGTLIAERSLNFKERELPAVGVSDYSAFTHAVESDEGQKLLVENPGASITAIPASATADDLFEAGTAALQSGNTSAAIPLLQRATELQPNHKQAWNDLGLAFMRIGKFDDAILAFRKQLDVNPADEHVNDYLGLSLQRLDRTDEAIAAFRKQIERNPLDTVAHSALGTLLLAQHKYSDAVPELDKAVILTPNNAALEVNLGRAYLNVNEKSKALDAFQKAIALSPTPPIWNDAAFSLAEQGVELDMAQRFAESAIAATATVLGKATLAKVTAADLARVEDLGDYWDTLGWVYFRQGNLEKAGSYVNAAWMLNQRGEVGDHLAQIYEKFGDKELAIHTYALALAAANPLPESRARLTLLLGGNAQVEDLVNKARPELEKLRTFYLKRPTNNDDASADFLILMSPAGNVGLSAKLDDVRFVTGRESLRPSADAIKALDFGPIFPGSSPAKLVRSGTLTCSAAANDCRLKLAIPEKSH